MDGERERESIFKSDSLRIVRRELTKEKRESGKGTRVLVWTRVKGSSSRIQGKAPIFKSKRGNQVRGVPMIVWYCILFVIDWIVMYEGMGIVISWKSEWKSGFWDFSRNRKAGRAWLPGDACTKPSFWVSTMNRLAAEDEPPGGTNPVSLFLVIFWCFGIPVVWPWCLYVLVWILMLIDSAYDDFAARYYFWYEIGRLGFMWRVGNNCAWYKFVIWPDVTKIRLFYDLQMFVDEYESLKWCIMGFGLMFCWVLTMISCQEKYGK